MLHRAKCSIAYLYASFFFILRSFSLSFSYCIIKEISLERNRFRVCLKSKSNNLYSIDPLTWLRIDNESNLQYIGSITFEIRKRMKQIEFSQSNVNHPLTVITFFLRWLLWVHLVLTILVNQLWQHLKIIALMNISSICVYFVRLYI